MNKKANKKTCPNIGPAMAGDLRLLGIHAPEQLREQDAYEMYVSLCKKTGSTASVSSSFIYFMSGGEPRPWWAFTEERKKALGVGFAKK